MKFMEVTTDHVELCDRRLTGLLYVLLNGEEYQVVLSNECISTKLLFRASLIALVNSGWLKAPIHDTQFLPGELYVLSLPLLSKEAYDYELVEEYFLTALPKTGAPIGVTQQEYINVQLDVLGMGSVDPFQGPVPTDFKADWVVGSVSYRKPHKLPSIKAMSSFPANSNPFHYDHSNMGCQLSGGWYAMYNQHAGLDRDGNPYKDPSYIIMVNSRTGQRFKINFDN